MDERFRIFFCILGGAGGFGLLGAAFGALARLLFLASGRTSGSPVGAAVIRAAELLRGADLSERARAVVSGAGDGAAFLGALGGLFGAYAGYRGPGETSLLVNVLLGGALLAAGAALFGVTGYLMAGAGTRVVTLLFVGGIAGALTGHVLGGFDGLLLGTVGGAFLGVCASALGPPRPPDEDESPGPD